MIFLVLGVSIRTIASPGCTLDLPPAATPPPVYTITIVKNFALADGIQQDIVTVNISPTPVPTKNVTFIINGGAG